MAVLERSQQQKITTSSMVGALLVGVAVFSGLLISFSSTLSNATGVRVGKIGALKLFEVSKRSIGNGNFEAGLRLFFGQLGTYFAIWLFFGFVLAKVRIRTSNSSN